MLGDCLELMKEIPDRSVDMVMTDPPYGTTACEWDSIIPLEPMWEHLKRVIKPNGAIVMTASQLFTTTLIASNMKMFKYCWVWDKHIPRGFQVAKYRPMMKHEDVAVFGRGRIEYYPIMVKRDEPVTVKNYSKKNKVSSNDIGKYNDGKSYTYTHKSPDSIIIGCWEANKGKVHPTQKPVSLMEYLIKTYTNPGETVLDFTMGSGTTGVAAKKLGRHFIGIELDPGYFEIAKKRIEDAEISDLHSKIVELTDLF
jgi:site-specific DNA-methyltransferase (adenine-specific)